MTQPNTLELSADQAGKLLTPEQKRFNTLVKQIDKVRKTIESWQTNVSLYQQAAVKVLQPLHADLIEERTTWVFALDEVHSRPGLTGNEKNMVSEMLCSELNELLNEGEPDDALKALFDKHNEVDFETDRQRMRLVMKEAMQMMSGVDLGDDDIQTDAELFARIQQGMQQHKAEDEQYEQAKAERAAKRKKTAAQQKRELEEQQATQSVREIFRQLASALHPDREPDAKKRQLKTEMMQKANAAYNQNDLLTLLELQLQLEQTDAAQIANSSAQRLGSFNKVLAKQLAELKNEAHQLEGRFRLSFQIDPYTQLHPEKLGQIIKAQATQIGATLADLRWAIKTLPNDKQSLKKWIKQQNRSAMNAPMFDFL